MSKCPTKLTVSEPLHPEATYFCSHHVARKAGRKGALPERCDICEARGCTPNNHSKAELELKNFCRGTVRMLSKSERAAWDENWETVFNTGKATSESEVVDQLGFDDGSTGDFNADVE